MNEKAKKLYNNKSSVKITSLVGKVFYSFVLFTIFSNFAVPNSLALNYPLKTFVSFIPLVTANEFLYLTRYSSISLILVVYTILFSLLIAGKLKIRTRSNSVIGYIVLLMILFGYLSISSIYSLELGYFISYAFLVLLMLTISKIPNNDISVLKSKLIKLIERAGLINSVFVLLQFGILANFQYFDINKWRIYRVVGISYDSILSALLTGITILIILNQSRNKKLTLSDIFKVLFLSISGIYTGSRTIFIVIAISFTLYFLFSSIPIKNKLKLFFIGLVGLSILLIAMNEIILDFLYLIKNTGFESTPRELKAELAKELFLNNPVFGVGTNQYSVYEYLYLSSYKGISGSNPHNIYYQLLAENGIIGFSLFIFGVFGVGKFLLVKKLFLPFSILVLYLIVGATLGILGSLQFMTIIITTCGLYIREELIKNKSQNGI